MNSERKWRRFFPEPGTLVKITTNAGLSWERKYVYKYIDFILASGYTPDILKFEDPETGAQVLLRFRNVDVWEF